MNKGTVIVKALREPSTHNFIRLLGYNLTDTEIEEAGLLNYATEYKLVEDYIENTGLNTAIGETGDLYFNINDLGQYYIDLQHDNGIQKLMKTMDTRIQIITNMRNKGCKDVTLVTLIKVIEEGIYNFSIFESETEKEDWEQGIAINGLYHKHWALLDAYWGCFDMGTDILDDIKETYKDLRERLYNLNKYTGLSYRYVLEGINNYAKRVSEPITTKEELITLILQQPGNEEASSIRLNKTIYILMAELGKFITKEEEYRSEFSFNKPLIVTDGIYTKYGIVHPDYLDEGFRDIQPMGTPLLDSYPDIKNYLISILERINDISDFTLVEFSIEKHTPVRYIETEYWFNKVNFIDILCLEDVGNI